MLGTQALATLIAVYGLFMTPLGWGWAVFVWGYAIAWFLVTDPVKLLAYRILDHAKAEPEAKAAPRPGTKAESTAQAKAAPERKAKAGPQPDAKAKTPSGSAPQIAK